MNRRDFLKRTALTAAALAVAPHIEGALAPSPMIGIGPGPIGAPGPIGPVGIPGFVLRSKNFLIGQLIMDKKGDVYRVQCRADIYDKEADQDDFVVTPIRSTINTAPDDTALAVFSSSMEEGNHRLSITQYYHGGDE